MVVILSHDYDVGTDDLLDYIAGVEFTTQDDIATDFHTSVKTIQRKMKKMKDSGELIVHRYADNNFIYMIGSDATRRWNKYEAYHIAKYRFYEGIDKIEQWHLELSDDEIAVMMEDLPLFDSEAKTAQQDNGHLSRFAGYGFNETIELSPHDKIVVENNIDQLIRESK